MSFILVVACSFLVYLAEKSDDQETEKEDGELNDLGEGLYFGMVVMFVFFDLFSVCTHIWDKVFKNRPSEICRRQPLKNLKLYGLLKQTMSLQIF